MSLAKDLDTLMAYKPNGSNKKLNLGNVQKWSEDNKKGRELADKAIIDCRRNGSRAVIVQLQRFIESGEVCGVAAGFIQRLSDRIKEL